MEDLTIEQWVEKYDHLKEFQKQILFITKEEDEFYKATPKITVQSGNNKREISIPLLQKLVTDDRYYEYVKKLFMDEISEFKSNWIIGGDTIGGVRLTKTEIVNGLRLVVNSGQVILSEEANNRFIAISNEISFERLCEKNKGNNFNITIDGKNISISIDSIIQFLQSPPEQYEDFFDLSKAQNIGALPKEYFAYAAVKFFKENKIFDLYTIPELITIRYNELTSLQKIDMQSLNKVTTTNDDNVAKTVVDEDLKTAILSGMPQDVSELDKAIFIYIKMCKTLTYDDEFYAVNQRGEVASKHENIDNVTNITLANNKVVCYEFNAIYAKLLEEVGITFETDSKVIGGFGGGHANLCFRSNKFLIVADSVTSILQGDLLQAKLNQPLVGLNCFNKNENTKKEFKEATSKMYELVARQEQEQQIDLPQSAEKTPVIERFETFDEILSQYQQMTSQDQFSLTLNEKLSMLVEKVNSTRMVGIDSMSYILQLRKIIFNEDERKNNIAVTIVRNNQPDDENKIAMASAIFTINSINMYEDINQNVYYFYNPLDLLTPISKEQLEERFKSKSLQYVEDKDPKIPGIVIEEGMKR